MGGPGGELVGCVEVFSPLFRIRELGSETGYGGWSHNRKAFLGIGLERVY
jgi:hypothetical protein